VRYFASLLLLGIALPFSSLAGSFISLPGWSELSFERHSLWVTARATVSIEARNDAQLGAVWKLRVEESVGENHARETQLMNPGSMYLLQRSRLTSGRNSRLKEYRYAAGKVERIRREPDTSQELTPPGWPVSSRRDIAYPAFEENAVLTSMPALLLVAGSVVKAPGQTATVYVHADLDFYRVQLSVVGEEQVEVDYSQTGGQQRVTGERTAIVVGLQVDPVGTPRDDPEFSLLGLESQVSILLDQQSLLPLQVRGRAPRIGETYINLVAADLHPPPGGELP
jgi:hypothetical protein